MSSIDDMIPGERYLAGDGYGYEYVWCVGTPTEEEIIEHMGECEPGVYVKIRYEESGEYDIWFHAPGYYGTGTAYVEPAPLSMEE